VALEQAPAQTQALERCASHACFGLAMATARLRVAYAGLLTGYGIRGPWHRGANASISIDWLLQPWGSVSIP